MPNHHPPKPEPRSAREILLGAQKERDWERQVTEWARRGGWHGIHVFRSSHPSPGGGGYSIYQGVHDGRNADHDDRKGVPDWLLVHPERKILLLPELKKESGRVSDDQERWHTMLRWIEHVAAPIWYPHDADEVRTILLGHGGPV